MTDTLPVRLDLSAARFPLGGIVVAANAHDRLDRLTITDALARHAAGDWGDLLAGVG